MRRNKEKIQKFKCPVCGLIIERKVDMKKDPDKPYCWDCNRGLLEVEIGRREEGN